MISANLVCTSDILIRLFTTIICEEESNYFLFITVLDIAVFLDLFFDEEVHEANERRNPKIKSKFIVRVLRARVG